MTIFKQNIEVLYHYKTLNPKGEIVVGHTYAVSKKKACENLLKQNLFPYQVHKVNSLQLMNKAKVSFTLLESFCTSLANFLKEGFPLAQALQAFQQTLPTAQPFHQIVQSLAKNVMAGESFHQSLKRYPFLFDAFFIMMIATGEATNKLEITLDKLTRYIQWQKETKTALKQALIYPLFVLLFVICLIVFLTTFLVPQLDKLYMAQHIQPSLNTKILLALHAKISLSHLFYWVLGIPCLWLILKFAQQQNQAIRIGLDSLWYKLPLIRYFAKEKAYSLYFFMLTFALEGHIPLSQAVLFIPQQTTNHWLKHLYNKIAKDFHATGELTTALKKSKFFDAMTLTFLANAEKNGRLHPTFQRLYALHHEQFLRACSRLAEKTPHLLLLIAGGIVLWLVTALFLPLYQQALQGVLNL